MNFSTRNSQLFTLSITIKIRYNKGITGKGRVHMKRLLVYWQKSNLIKATFFNIAIMFSFFVVFIYATSFTIEQFTVEYYDEMMSSANQRFSQQFDRVLLELDELSLSARNDYHLTMGTLSDQQEALIDLVQASPMVNGGFIVDEQRVIESSVLQTASLSNLDLTAISFVPEPYLQKAHTLEQDNLLELLIPLSNTQLHLFIDLASTDILSSLFHSLSFSDTFYIAIFNENQDLVFTYDESNINNEGELFHLKIQESLNDERNTDTVTHDEDSHYMMATQPLIKDGWTLTLFVPEILTERFRLNIFKTLLPLLVILAVLFLLIVIYAYYRSQKPYQALVKAIDELSEGDYTHRIRVTNEHTRIGVINTKFNHMVQELEKSRLALAKNEKALASQKDYLNRIINVSPMLIYTISEEGTYTLVNDKYAYLFGYTGKEMVGKHALNVTNDKAATHYQLKLHRSILLSGETISYEDQQVMPDKSLRWYRVTKQPIKETASGALEILMVATDITEIKQNQEKIQYQAYHDELTGIGNRKLFKTMVEQAIEQTDQQNEGFAVMFLDLDRFKYVNDTFGHDAGDQLLIEVAKRIETVKKDTDYVFRFGGDEFTILSYYKDSRQEVTELAKIIIQTLTKPYTFNGHSFIVTASIGISLYPKHSQSLNELTKYADLSMYQAKQQGKNTFRYYTPALETEVSHAIQLETDLFQAEERNELYVVYQPIVDTHTKTIIAVEALIRWQHNKLGAIAPNVFIPIAERNGLMLRFSKFVLQRATQTVAEYNARHDKPIQLYLNLTEAECQNEHTLQTIIDQLETVGLQQDQLVIELNEHLTRDKCKKLKTNLKQFQLHGIKAAIDSFGDHYLSLRQLKTLPFAIIKLSQATLQDALIDSEALASYKRLIKLAKRMGLMIIQEGVESEEDVHLIEGEGLDAYQGFLISQPLTKEQFEQDY